MSRLERVRLTRQEQKTAQMVGAPIVLLTIILIKGLWKIKRWLLILFLAGFVIYGFSTISVNADSPKADLTQPVVATPTPTSGKQQIIDYINTTFGEDAPNAIKVFTCESGLNPRAYNDNTSWGGVGHDLGVAQINDHYQGVTNADFLYNYKINILMAKQIFDKWGHNFHAWTCGRKLGL